MSCGAGRAQSDYSDYILGQHFSIISIADGSLARTLSQTDTIQHSQARERERPRQSMQLMLIIGHKSSPGEKTEAAKHNQVLARIHREPVGSFGGLASV